MTTPFAAAGNFRPRGGARIQTALQIFSTCPSSAAEPDGYMRRISDVARWSEEAGCAGMLIGADNSLADPWLVSQVVIQSTESLCPLVAVQPAHMHPYSVAKAVSTLAFLHGRRVFLNIVAGGFKSDLAALSDTPRDRRHQRLIEYTRIVQQLLNGRGPVTFDGKFYNVTNLTLRPPLPAEMHPGILISGSPEAGMVAARETGAIAVLYPEPPRSDYPSSLQNRGRYGVRIGVITRPRGEDAWASALARFPEDREGRLHRQLAPRTSDSRDTYWVYPFENYQTTCPYLVGSYQNVAEELARYAASGYHTFILDIPPAREEFEHIGKAFQTASRKTAGVAV
jgi:alkanesulfonate monooxygenase